MAKMGHEWFVVPGVGLWDDSIRTIPNNWHIVDAPPADCDAAIVSHDWQMFERFKDLPLPIIFSVLSDCSEGVFSDHVDARLSAVHFLSQEVADRWALRDPRKKAVIEMGIDDSQFLEYTGEGGGDILTVGHRIGRRWDKGHCQLMTMHEVFHKCALVGPGNEGLPCAIGILSHSDLLKAYSTYKIYFNPGPIVGISVAEAMLSGMPIVSFRSINLKNLIVDGVNGYVVDTLDGAAMRIKKLMADAGLRRAMGQEARKAARHIFSLRAAKIRWDSLLAKVVGDWKLKHR